MPEQPHAISVDPLRPSKRPANLRIQARPSSLAEALGRLAPLTWPELVALELLRQEEFSPSDPRSERV